VIATGVMTVTVTFIQTGIESENLFRCQEGSIGFKVLKDLLAECVHVGLFTSCHSRAIVES